MGSSAERGSHDLSESCVANHRQRQPKHCWLYLGTLDRSFLKLSLLKLGLEHLD